MASSQQLSRSKSTDRRIWFERFMAIAATANLGLVLFDFSYVPGRNFWLLGELSVSGLTVKIPLPPITRWYDPIKGIEPHRDTENYLNAVNALKLQVNQTGLESPQVQTSLQQLGNQSNEIIQNNPFALANKSGTLEKIKDRMRDRIYGKSQRGKSSARQAFKIFWSQEHLSQFGWKREINFFDQQIRPLFETNYYRHIGENGEFVDLFFWQINKWFFLLFGVEFLARTFYISRTNTGVRWIDAMLWRWYDIFLLLPVWRWLRVIPVGIRLNRAKLVNFERVQRQINQGFVASFAEELTEVIVVRVVSQLQGAVQRGEVTRWLLQTDRRPSYINIDQVNEAEAITNLLLQLTVHQVLPKIQPDIEAILRHNIEGVLNGLPIYRGLQNIPGVENLAGQLTEQLASQLTQAVNDGIVAVEQDSVGAKLTSTLVKHFSEALASEVQKKQTLSKIQDLLSNILEQVKLNYVKHLAQEDVEQVMEETRRLHLQASGKHIEGKDSMLSRNL